MNDMNASNACLTTYVKLANTKSLYFKKKKWKQENHNFAQKHQKALDLFYSADIIGEIH